jgi:transglutaminase-like putative cysteine protease
MRIYVDHRTEYRYERPVVLGEHSLFLRPRESHSLHVASFSLETDPVCKIRWVRDCFNNVVAVASFNPEPTSSVVFQCRMRFEVIEDNPFDFILEKRAAEFPFPYDERERSALSPYLQAASSTESAALSAWLQDTLGDPRRTRDTTTLLTDLNRAVHGSIAYTRRDEEGTRSADETLRLRSGSCRDMAELFIAASRALGLAARFVSGYLYESAASSTSGSSHNAATGSMHAWAEVYLPGAGWRGFDPTNGIMTTHHFVTSAVSNRPDWVNPIQGQYLHRGRVDSRMSVELNVGAVEA